jgi:hypothetical protein
MAEGGSKTDVGGTIKMLLWAVVGVLLGVVAFVAAPMVESDAPPPLAAAPRDTQALSAHCTHFISLAKAKYGTIWKDRLDPSDSICAEQVDEAWVRQWNKSAPASASTEEPAAVSGFVARSTEATAMPVEQAAAQPMPEPVAAPRGNPETYCLNVISLAKTKFGAEWQQKLTPDEASACTDNVNH